MAEKEIPAERLHKVTELWLRGNTKEEIVKKTGYSPKQVSADLKIIRFQFQPKTLKTIEYYRNKVRARLDMISNRAWGFVDDADVRHGARVSALRLVKEVEAERMKVDGIVTDKMLAGPEKKAEELSRRLLEIASQKDKGNGHDEKEDEVVKDAVTDQGAEETAP